jgi:fructoselysine-6-P-deglycase FrlB-like protein
VTYSIFDMGSLVVSFESEDEGHDALERLAEEGSARGGLLLVAFDERGSAVADCAPGERITTAA